MWKFTKRKIEEGFLNKDEESKLVKKFQEYTTLEKRISKKNFFSNLDKSKSGIWGTRFVISSIIQGSIITGITFALLFSQFFLPDTTLLQSLIAFDGSSKLFYFGYFVYFSFVIMLAVTGILYNYLEITRGKYIDGSNSILAWIHLIGLNVGGAGTTLALIYSGLVGLEIDIASNNLMFLLSTWMVIFGGILFSSMLVGGIFWIRAFFQKDLLVDMC